MRGWGMEPLGKGQSKGQGWPRVQDPSRIWSPEEPHCWVGVNEEASGSLCHGSPLSPRITGLGGLAPGRVPSLPDLPHHPGHNSGTVLPCPPLGTEPPGAEEQPTPSPNCSVSEPSRVPASLYPLGPQRHKSQTQLPCGDFLHSQVRPGVKEAACLPATGWSQYAWWTGPQEGGVGWPAPSMSTELPLPKALHAAPMGVSIT